MSDVCWTALMKVCVVTSLQPPQDGSNIAKEKQLNTTNPGPDITTLTKESEGG